MASVGLSLGVPLTAVPSVAATAQRAAAVPGEPVLPPAARAVPRATQILNAGTTGFLWAQESDDRLLWTDHATGTTTALAERLPAPVAYDINRRTDGGTVAEMPVTGLPAGAHEITVEDGDARSIMLVGRGPPQLTRTATNGGSTEWWSPVRRARR
ncbi:MAG TPA: hypothetical protein VF657_20060 [Actinoplanes sp.]